MDFKYVISQFLGIQDVIIEDIKIFKKDLRVVVVARQNRRECYCSRCGLQLSGVHEWIFKELKAPPLGVFSEVILKFYLRDVNKSIHTGMLLVEYFHSMLDKKTVKSFHKAMITWYLVVRESKLKPFLELAKTIRKYRKNIEAYITSRLTTGVAEGLNNKIKVLKRMGYGYNNETSFMRKILQRCGYLNHLSINTDEFFFRMPHP